MLTNTYIYEYLAIILRSLRLVANCIRKPIRHIFATIWRICREYIFLHSQGYSPQCETSITAPGNPHEGHSRVLICIQLDVVFIANVFECGNFTYRAYIDAPNVTYSFPFNFYISKVGQLPLHCCYVSPFPINSDHLFCSVIP